MDWSCKILCKPYKLEGAIKDCWDYEADLCCIIVYLGLNSQYLAENQILINRLLFKISFWCLQISQKNNEIFSRISALVSKGLFGVHGFFQKTNEEIRFYYC